MNHILKHALWLIVGLSMTACGDKAPAPADAPTTAASTAPTAAASKAAKAPKAAEAPKGVPADGSALPKIDPKDDLGSGPITTKMTLTALDDALAEAGKKLYREKCTACHKLKKRYVGPSLKGVTLRRRPEWVMNMILDPVGMVAKNAAAKALLVEFSAPMANQSLTNDEARSILEYFRRVDSKIQKVEGEQK
jgi:cytochrome c1